MHLVSIFCAAGKIRDLKKYKFVLHSCKNITFKIFKNYMKNLKHSKTIHFKILKKKINQREFLSLITAASCCGSLRKDIVKIFSLNYGLIGAYRINRGSKFH